MAIFSTSYTKNTIVGNDPIRGVSNRERNEARVATRRDKVGTILLVVLMVRMLSCSAGRCACKQISMAPQPVSLSL